MLRTRSRRTSDLQAPQGRRFQRRAAAELPHRTFPTLFNCYAGGQPFGMQRDSAIRAVRGTSVNVRTDVSATLFLGDLDTDDGGEPVIEGNAGAQPVKLPAGSTVLYPASTLHHVTQVTRGQRLASFFRVQSMMRDDGARSAVRPRSDDPALRRREWLRQHPRRRRDENLSKSGKPLSGDLSGTAPLSQA